MKTSFKIFWNKWFFCYVKALESLQGTANKIIYSKWDYYCWEKDILMPVFCRKKKKNQIDPIRMLRNIQQIIKALRIQSNNYKVHAETAVWNRIFLFIWEVGKGGSLSVLKMKIGGIFYHCVLPQWYFI